MNLSGKQNIGKGAVTARPFDGRKALFLLVYSLAMLALGVATVEIYGRTVLEPRYRRDERSRNFEYNTVLGWFPKKNDQRTFEATRPIVVRHNRDGFRDDEPGLKDRPRVLFLGDSFVWGYDVEKDERFTEKLQGQLADKQVLNLGVSGYSTDQEWILLRREYDRYRPDVVFLILDQNDRAGNSSNMAYGYFKPYFVNDRGRWVPRGIPVPKNAMYRFRTMKSFWGRSYCVMILLKVYERFFERQEHRPIRVPDPTEGLIGQMNSFVTRKGGQFIVGLIDPDPVLARFCRNGHIPVADLTEVDLRYRYPSNGSHWDPSGHERVAGLLEQTLRRMYASHN